jgi:polyhydroxyalkanoate synthase subunit PhaC
MLQAADSFNHPSMIDDPSAVTPYKVIYEGGKASVRHYAPVERTHQTPIVLVYALIKRPFILDLRSGNSVVEDLTRQGFEVFLIDWLPPTTADSWRGVDAYVNQDLASAVCAIQIHQQVEKVTVLGYCLGGLLSVMYAALHPRAVKNLVTLTSPLDMSIRETPLYYWIDWLDEDAVAWVVDTFGNCPAWLLQNVFTAMASTSRIASYFGLVPESERDRYARLYPAFRRWLASDVAIAGRLLRELAIDFFKKNLLVRGRMTLGGNAIDLSQVTANLLNVVAELDAIVHPKSSLALLDLVGCRDKANLIFPTGHLGVVVGNEAHAGLWPQIGDWLGGHD